MFIKLPNYSNKYLKKKSSTTVPKINNNNNNSLQDDSDFLKQQLSTSNVIIKDEIEVDNTKIDYLYPFYKEISIEFQWSWNFMINKSWRNKYTGDEAFQDKSLLDFRLFCSNSDERLVQFFDEFNFENSFD
jgi:hypothetical protein